MAIWIFLMASGSTFTVAGIMRFGQLSAAKEVFLLGFGLTELCVAAWIKRKADKEQADK